MSSHRSAEKSIRSHSIHVAIARDYQRIKTSQKQEIRLQYDLLNLERRLRSHAKWNERADRKNSIAINPPEQLPMTLEEFMERAKLKHENISNAKNVANENIRRH
jgi:hypothetical protein